MLPLVPEENVKNNCEGLEQTTIFTIITTTLLIEILT